MSTIPSAGGMSPRHGPRPEVRPDTGSANVAHYALFFVVVGFTVCLTLGLVG